MNRIICASLIGFIFALGLTSCATVTAPPAAPTKQLSAQERQTLLTRLTSWQINGKIAVHTANDAGSATVDWSQNQGSYIVSLYAPLGAGNMKLSGQPGKVTLETSDGQHLSASNPEELLVRGWGFNLPVSYLKYWIRGLPAPGVAAQTQFDDNHRLIQLVQQGWRVQYLDYTTVGNLELPSKLAINSSTLSSKIIIYSWKIN